MKFLELNKKRHAIKHFTDQPVDPKDVRTAIEIATLAPSAHNSQPWKFVVVRQKNAEVRNAKTYRQNQESAHRISTSGVDEQLQQHGWFRDSGSDGVQCVRADLPQSCGHSENETSDSGSQSDL